MDQDDDHSDLGKDYINYWLSNRNLASFLDFSSRKTFHRFQVPYEKKGCGRFGYDGPTSQNMTGSNTKLTSMTWSSPRKRCLPGENKNHGLRKFTASRNLPTNHTPHLRIHGTSGNIYLHEFVDFYG